MTPGVLFGLAVVGLVFVGLIGGAVGLLILWPRTRALERRMANLEARLALAAPVAGPAAAAPAPVAAPSLASAPSPSPASAPSPASPRAPASHPQPVATHAAPAEPAPGLAAELPESVPEVHSVSPSWEEAVGANWLNRLGVLITVIGIALAVSYSFARIGPAGRIGLGFALSLTMLGAGVLLARREAFRTYGHGLVAGGWAGTYFTTYAMHGVPAARVIESVAAGTLALTAVSVAMFAHALRYRSQVVASLTLIVVYATLATTPLNWFALLAAVPIAAAVLAIAAWRRWPGLSALAIGATYGIAMLRGAGDLAALDEPSIAPFLLLGTYWITFELADLLALERTPTGQPVETRHFALNAVGLAGSTVMVVPPADERLPAFLAVMAAGYVASALARRRRTRAVEGPATADTGGRFTTFHAAMGMALGLVMWATAGRFDDTRLVATWLFQAELVAVAGLLLRDGWLRIVGLGGIGLAAMGALELAGHRLPEIVWPIAMHQVTPVLLLVAAAIFVNREWLRRLPHAGLPVERGSTALATVLLALAIAIETTTVRAGAAWVAVAAILVEFGVRGDRAYRYQGYVLGLLGAWILLTVFGADPRSIGTRDIWITLGGSTAIVWAVAARLAAFGGSGAARGEGRFAAGAACCLGVALLATFEWQVLPVAWLGLGWVVTGHALLWAGIPGERALLRLLAYPLVAAGAARAMTPIARSGAATATELATAVAALALVTAAPVLARWRGRAAGAGEPSDADRIAQGALTAIGTALLAWLVAEEAEPSQITLVWGLVGIALFGLGFPARERALRLAGLGMLAGCVLKLFVYDLSELDAVPRILSFVVLGLVLLGVSWGYTRKRPPAS